MVKSIKKVNAGSHKPITDFFTRSSTASQPVKSRDASQAESSTTKGGSLSQETLKTTPSRSATRSFKPNSEVTASAQSGRVFDPQLSCVSALSSRKRSRSPDIQSNHKPSCAAATSDHPNPRTPERINCETERNSAVTLQSVALNSTPNPQHKKKARLSASILQATDDSVPSSQSDEDGLRSPSYDSTDSKGLGKRHVSPLTPDPIPGPLAMIIDEEMTSEESLATNVYNTLPTLSLPSLPPTPVKHTQATKTAQIIADIKAKALAKSLACPIEEEPLTFDEDLEISDDEDLPILPLAAMNVEKKKESTQSEKDADKKTSRYLLRNRSASPSAPSRVPKTIVPVQKPLKKPNNPFASLLREKRLADKGGAGDAAIRQADDTVLRFSKDTLTDDMDEDDEDLFDFNLSSVVRDLLEQRNVGGEAGVGMDEEEREKAFGVKSGETIINILQKDEAHKAVTNESEKASSGIQFWLPKEPSGMQVDIPLRLSGSSPFVRMVNVALDDHDYTRAAVLLNATPIAVLSAENRSTIVSSLADIALSSHDTILADAATKALEHFWATSLHPLTSTLTFSNILASVQHMGPDLHILRSQGWTTDEATEPTNFNREATIHRLVNLVGACAQSRRLKVDEIPDIVLVLMLIGMDLSSTPGLMRDVSKAIHLSMTIISDLGSEAKAKELSVGLKALRCCASFSTLNKLRFISFLSNGAGAALRVAVFVAYFAVVGDHTPVERNYSHPLPLVDILEQLGHSAKKDLGKFTIHKDTDFVDLGHHVDILAIAVSDIKERVDIHREMMKVKGLLASHNKIPLELRHLQSDLEALHASISDSRATQLDRSKTKANIKALSMNIHYQCEIWSRARSQAPTIKQYFT